MSFPSPSLTPPTLSNYQFSYLGLTFGGVVPGDPYQLQKLDPLVLSAPPVVGNDPKRPLDQGEFGGIDTLPGRDIPIDLIVKKDGTSFDHARQALGQVMNVAGAIEQPLWMQLPSGIFACMARPKKYNGPPIDVVALLGGGGVANLLFHATDPRWYAAPSKSASVGLPVPLTGITFPVTFPATFGGGSAGGFLSVYNNGLFEMKPKLVFTGPCTNPYAINSSLPGAPSIGFTLTLAAGDVLVVDTDFQTAVFTLAGTTVGASRRSALKPGSTWWNLPPGLSQIQFGSSDGTAVAGTLAVQSADAWLTL